MARFDVYTFAGPIKLVVDVQADLFERFNTRIVVPLRPVTKNRSSLIRRLNPVFQVEGIDYYLSTSDLAAAPVSFLKNKKANLEHHRQDIIDALDFLMQGF